MKDNPQYSMWRSSGWAAAGYQGASKGPRAASVEMNATPDNVINTLSSMSDYVVMSKKAFPNEASPVTFHNFARAIDAFEAILITPAAPFDQDLEGDTNALDDRQNAGLKLFMETGCSSCHNGINVGGRKDGADSRASASGQVPLKSRTYDRTVISC
ncbi:cytochrome-c peroxidase [Bradyrhizobium genosp. P]|uniref:cytochrome-c peroxidase n=1 Tax=Bradyrhizobium genosp. P TaxID=83641 RepID=UPI003CE89D1A